MALFAVNLPNHMLYSSSQWAVQLPILPIPLGELDPI